MPRTVSKPRGRRPPPQPNRRLRFRVVYEHTDLVVVVKRPGLVMHPGPGHGTDTLLNALIGRFPDLLALGDEREYGLVSRLDRGTSGLVVVARSVPGYEGLVQAFSERRVEKVYLALVAGAPAAEGEVDQPIGGKGATTRWEVVESTGEVSLLRVRPLSGRTHQIRIHLAEVGFPVLRDDRYGSGADDLTAKLYLPRLALHAHQLAFQHPVSDERVTCEEPLPRDLRRAWKRARRVTDLPGDDSAEDSPCTT